MPGERHATAVEVASVPETTDSALLTRFVMRQAVEAGLPPAVAARECAVPEWAGTSEDVRLPSQCYLHAWERVEHGLGDSDVAVRIAGRYVIGGLGLYDYLFATAPTLGAGLDVCGPFMSAISTNFHFEPAPQTEAEVSFGVTMINGEGRGRELAMQFALAALFTRSRIVTAAPVPAARVAFRQRAPRSHASLVEVFGTAAIDFGAPADTVTFHVEDLNIPLITADARLATVLQRHAATLPDPKAATSWSDRLAALLADALDRGPVSLGQIAGELAMSPRTLQRRLAEDGTTWRTELDRARRNRYEQATETGPLKQARQAALLAYDDPRSLRRAKRRWSR